ncbi:MAG: ABC transporter permease [Gammaproteobacteria bacterium]|nr:ABC transporter permease [Gammaproteobacteria bacterium]NND55165.1 ABC transporter permease [Gammaproteobacteria bacterium]
MQADVVQIPLSQLALAFIPVVMLLYIMYRWSASPAQGLYAIARMLLQLILIGYVLTFLFATDTPVLVIAMLCVMLAAASWIAIRPLRDIGSTGRHLTYVLVAIGSAGGLTLALITLLVLNPDPWFEPRIVVTLGGMIFASAMNAVSLAAERFAAELSGGAVSDTARRNAFQAALIPLLNSLFAVGLVSLPGMMTGQVLSGIDPLVAVRYQIMVMCMLTGASGIAAAIYLTLAARKREPE